MGRLPRPRGRAVRRGRRRSRRSSARSRTSSTTSPGLAGARVLTGLDTLLRIVDQRVENLRVPILLVVFQIGAVTLAVLAGVAALTLTRQAFELSVLHSRGFSRRTLLLAQGVQATLAALVAFPLGLLIGLGLASLAGRTNGPSLPGVLFPVQLNPSATALGALTAAIGALILLLLSLPYISRTVLEERRALSREDRPLLSRVPVELIVLPVGIFAFIQLRGGTKPKPGAGTIDPLVLLAPTLLLFAASFLVLRLLLFVFHRMDRRIGRSKHVSDLPGRPQAEPRPRRRLRGGAPAPARDGPARGLDVVPSDRADQPRGRGAHDRGCRLEHPGLAAGRRAAGDRRHAREHDPGGPHRAGHRGRARTRCRRRRSRSIRRPTPRADGGARTSPRRRSTRSSTR